METKKWWQSKVVWEGAGATLAGVAGVLIDAFETGVSIAAVITAIIGVATIISRIWFTTKTIS